MTSQLKPKVPCPHCGVARVLRKGTPDDALCRDCNRIPKRISSQEVMRRRSHCLATAARIERWFDWDRKASTL